MRSVGSDGRDPADNSGNAVAPASPVPSDLTARERILQTALELYAQFGEDRVSMRRVSGEVGVTIGLIQHHFGTKDGLRRAVDGVVVDQIVAALATADHSGSPAQVIAARDAAVRQMLERNPVIVHYLNRALLEPDGRGASLLEALVELTTRVVEGLRTEGLASTRTSDKVQVVRTLMGQVGELFLDPVVAAIWGQLDGDPDRRPTIRITVEGA